MNFWLAMANNPSTNALMFPFGMLLCVMTVIALVVSSPQFHEDDYSYAASRPTQQVARTHSRAHAHSHNAQHAQHQAHHH